MEIPYPWTKLSAHTLILFSSPSTNRPGEMGHFRFLYIFFRGPLPDDRFVGIDVETAIQSSKTGFQLGGMIKKAQSSLRSKPQHGG